MQRKTKFGIILLGVLLAGAAFWWMENSTRPPQVAPEGPGETRPTSPNPGAQPLVFTNDPSAPVSGGEGTGEGLPMNGGEAPAAPTLPTAGDILADPDEDHVRVAKKLAALVVDPRQPIEERQEALAHTLNLSAGNEAEVLTPLIKDPNLPEPLAETILSEALNRPLGYQADLYLLALGTRKDPELLKFIREHLAFLTGGEDRGPNPADWAADIKAARAEWPE